MGVGTVRSLVLPVMFTDTDGLRLIVSSPWPLMMSVLLFAGSTVFCTVTTFGLGLFGLIVAPAPVFKVTMASGRLATVKLFPPCPPLMPRADDAANCRVIDRIRSQSRDRACL